MAKKTKDPWTTSDRARIIVISVLAVIVVVSGIFVAINLVQNAIHPARAVAGQTDINGVVLVSRSASTVEQGDVCNDMPSPTLLDRFTKPVTIDEFVACRSFTTPFEQKSITRDASNSAALDELSTQLATPDKRTGSETCSPNAALVSSWAVKVEGKWLRPGLPLNKCGKPLTDPLNALRAVRALTGLTGS